MENLTHELPITVLQNSFSTSFIPLTLPTSLMDTTSIHRILASDQCKAAGLGLCAAFCTDVAFLRVLRSFSPKGPSKKMRELSLDMALTPLRLSLIPLNLPILLRTLLYQPLSALDMKLTTISWVVLSTGYIFEMLNTKTGAISIVHHSIAIICCLCVNVVLLTDAPDDTHWLRLLSSVLVFAVACGGTFTTSLRLLYHFFPTAKGPQERNIARLTSLFTWGLTFSVACAWSWKIWYFVGNHLEMYSSFGLLTPIILLTALLLFGVQWWWVFIFHNKKDAMWLGRSVVRPRELRRSLADPLSVICSALFLGWLYGASLCAQGVMTDIRMRIQ